MPESPLHASMKDHADQWAKTWLGCGITTQEASIARRWQFDCRPDVLGVCTDHPDSRELFLSHDIEVEPDLRGVAAEYQKKHRRDPFRSITDHQWLIHPKGIELDLDGLQIPVWVGLATMTEDGVVDVYRRAERIKGNRPRAVIGILCGLIKHLERSTGKRADEARPSRNNGGLSAAMRGRLIAHLEEFPYDPLSATARDLKIDMKELRDAALKGIPGVSYDPVRKVLDLETQPASV